LTDKGRELAKTINAIMETVFTTEEHGMDSIEYWYSDMDGFSLGFGDSIEEFRELIDAEIQEG
jgi:hypothetical protein